MSVLAGLGAQGPQVALTLGSSQGSEASLPPALQPVLGRVHGFFSETVYTLFSFLVEREYLSLLVEVFLKYPHLFLGLEL